MVKINYSSQLNIWHLNQTVKHNFKGEPFSHFDSINSWWTTFCFVFHTIAQNSSPTLVYPKFFSNSWWLSCYFHRTLTLIHKISQYLFRMRRRQYDVIVVTAVVFIFSALIWKLTGAKCTSESSELQQKVYH